MAAGFTTTDTGPGVRAVRTITIAVGGVQRWLPLSSTTTTIAGIRWAIVNTIRIRVITKTSQED
jgi:hypothetical protein